MSRSVPTMPETTNSKTSVMERAFLPLDVGEDFMPLSIIGVRLLRQGDQQDRCAQSQPHDQQKAEAQQREQRTGALGFTAQSFLLLLEKSSLFVELVRLKLRCLPCPVLLKVRPLLLTSFSMVVLLEATTKTVRAPRIPTMAMAKAPLGMTPCPTWLGVGMQVPLTTDWHAGGELVTVDVAVAVW